MVKSPNKNVKRLNVKQKRTLEMRTLQTIS
jgi:hypothetical protein